MIRVVLKLRQVYLGLLELIILIKHKFYPILGNYAHLQQEDDQTAIHSSEQGKLLFDVVVLLVQEDQSWI